MQKALNFSINFIKSVQKIRDISSERSLVYLALPPMIPRPGSSRSQISLLFKVFLRGRPLKGFTMYTVITFSERFDFCPFLYL